MRPQLHVPPRLPLHPPPLTRALHTSPARPASVLFALHALSNSRETQHFNKLSSLHRSEHSPPLKLIQTSEIDPYPLPTPPKILLSPSPFSPRSSNPSPPQTWDRQALAAGRAVLAANARHAHRLSRSLSRARAREEGVLGRLEREKEAWGRERARLRGELRAAGGYIVAAVGVATGVAMWRFWPEGERAVVVAGGKVDSGRVGREIVEAALKKEAVGTGSVGGTAVTGGEMGDGLVAAGTPVVMTNVIPVREVGVEAVEVMRGSGSWWKGLFWKQG